MSDPTCDNCQHWVPTLRSRTANICFVKTRDHNPGLDWNDPKRLDDPAPIRRQGAPIPPPKKWMPDSFGKPRSLEGLKPERFERKAYR